MQAINSNYANQPMTYPQQQTQSMIPSYNAVKIDIHNPAVNAPGQYGQMYPADASAAQAAMAAPQVASNPMPMCPVPPNQMAYPAAYPVTSPIPAQPNVPQPTQITPVAPIVNGAPQASPDTSNQTPAVPAPNTDNPSAVQPNTAAPAVAVDKPVETQANSVAPYVSMLGSSAYDEQFKAMDEIVSTVLNNPEQATKFVDNDIYKGLINIVEANTENLQGPTENQLALRSKIITNRSAEEKGKKPPFEITKEQEALADEFTDFEKAETNKLCALITMAHLGNLFNSVVEQQKGSVAPLSDIPCTAVIVDSIKNNVDPKVREQAIIALSMLQRPEYKAELETIYKLALNDESDDVCATATKALEKLDTLNK